MIKSEHFSGSTDKLQFHTLTENKANNFIMSTVNDHLHKQLAAQQQHLEQLTKEVAQFRTLALRAHKDVEQLRANQDYLLKIVRPLLPVLRKGKSLLNRLKSIRFTRSSSTPSLKIQTDLKKK